MKKSSSNYHLYKKRDLGLPTESFIALPPYSLQKPCISPNDRTGNYQSSLNLKIIDNSPLMREYADSSLNNRIKRNAHTKRMNIFNEKSPGDYLKPKIDLSFPEIPNKPNYRDLSNPKNRVRNPQIEKDTLKIQNRILTSKDYQIKLSHDSKDTYKRVL